MMGEPVKKEWLTQMQEKRQPDISLWDAWFEINAAVSKRKGQD